ncbi:MAG: DUF6057 family protein [Tannerellaceae bacterium]|jgi:hypothetical protein|nr:DUF6057 family protein [Tannerellaceae bacterium]
MKGTFRGGVLVLFFVLYAVYLWVGINPALYLIKGYREFYTDLWFFRRFTDFPGYPVEYLARLLTHCYAFPFVASIGTAVLGGAIYLLGFHTFKGSRHADWIVFLPLAVLLYLHTLYEHRILFDLHLLSLFFFLCLFVRLLRLLSFRPFVVFPFLLAVLFYLNGIIVAGVFVVSVCLILIFRKGKSVCWFVYPLECVAVGFVFHLLFDLSVPDLHQEFVDISRIYPFRYGPFVLYLSVCILPVCLHGFDSYVPQENVRRLLLPAVLIILAGWRLLTFDADERNGLAVQHYAINGQWEKALEYAAKCEYPDKDAVLLTNEALYHTGKIYDNLFLYNQSMGSKGLLSAEISNYSEIVPNQDIFLHLGALSLSIIWGTEATNVYGANPYVLKNLVKAYLAGGYPAEAKKILNLLSHTPFQQEWVRRYQPLAGDTLLIDQDKELSACRQAQTPVAVVSRQSAMMNLYLLSQENALNKMAYDYLLIGSLLDNEIDNFASSLVRLKEYGYTSLPKLYLEGLIYHSLYADRAPIRIREFTFDESILYRFDSFRKDLLLAQQNPGQMQEWLENKYRDTYWYYILFRSQLGEEERKEAFLRIIQ